MVAGMKRSPPVPSSVLGAIVGGLFLGAGLAWKAWGQNHPPQSFVRVEVTAVRPIGEWVEKIARCLGQEVYVDAGLADRPVMVSAGDHDAAQLLSHIAAASGLFIRQIGNVRFMTFNEPGLVAAAAQREHQWRNERQVQASHRLRSLCERMLSHVDWTAAQIPFSALQLLVGTELTFQEMNPAQQQWMRSQVGKLLPDRAGAQALTEGRIRIVPYLELGLHLYRKHDLFTKPVNPEALPLYLTYPRYVAYHAHRTYFLSGKLVLEGTPPSPTRGQDQSLTSIEDQDR